MDSQIDIKVPIWKSRAFGVADFRLRGEGFIFVTCSYKDTDGNLMYPEMYRMQKNKAREYSSISMGKFIGREIPIDDFEVV